MSNARAFTLLELLLATALTAVLMVGVLAVVANLGAPEAAAGHVPDRERNRALEACLDLLREDLAHAVAVDASQANALTLVGYAALDDRARERTHRPVRVRYGLERIDGRAWLVRRQDALDVKTNETVQRDLVCCGFTGFQLIEDRYDWGLPEEAPTAEPSTVAAGGGAATARTAATGQADPRFWENGERRSYGIGNVGVAYYFEYLPTWAQEQILTHGRIVNDLTATIQEQRREREEAVRESGVDLRGAGSLWRLRVRTAENTGPAHERVVTILLGQRG